MWSGKGVFGDSWSNGHGWNSGGSWHGNWQTPSWGSGDSTWATSWSPSGKGGVPPMSPVTPRGANLFQPNLPTALPGAPPHMAPPSSIPPRPVVRPENGFVNSPAGRDENLENAALMAYQQVQQEAYGSEPDGGPWGGHLPRIADLDTEVKAFAVRFNIEDHLQARMLEAFKQRGEKWEADLKDFTACMSRARSPAGFLIVKLSDLEKAIEAEKGPNTDKPRELCANFRRGFCTRGAACKFSHDVQTGLSKANVANLIAEAKKNVANQGGFSGGFSSSADPASAADSGFGDRRKPDRSRKPSRSSSTSRSRRRRRDSRSRGRRRR
mmetsp:Transcript_27756/g.64506  ORF Transcript_27756/g.64506 Transcript_27756/m.64506 type:complete len:325 (+) Transcript_27756:60-1034(+)